MRHLLVGAGDGNRTHAASLEGWNSTIELHSHTHVSQNCSTMIPRKVRFVNTFFKKNYKKIEKSKTQKKNAKTGAEFVKSLDIGFLIQQGPTILYPWTMNQ